MPIEKEGFSIIPSFWGAAKELSNWKTCLVKKDEILRWLLLGKGGDSSLSLRMTKKRGSEWLKKEGSDAVLSKAKEWLLFCYSFFTCYLFLSVPLFYLSPWGEAEGSPGFFAFGSEWQKKGSEWQKSGQNDRGRFRKEGILRSLALGSIIKIVSIISGSFFIAYFWAILLKWSYNSLYAIHHLASFTS